jgi:RNA polymerase sigma-70 factor (ECF subfamily)
MQQLRQESDAVLVKLYEEGNDEAFDVLLERYQSAVFGYILTAVHDSDVANDVFQDTFMRVIMQIRNHRYTENGKFSGWVIRIAHNLIIDSTRQNRVMLEIPNDSEKERMMNKAMPLTGNREMEWHNELTYRTLTDMVARLPETQREVVQMRMYDHLSFKEIAEKTNCSINTALGRMRYAVINLRKMSAKRDLTLVDCG